MACMYKASCSSQEEDVLPLNALTRVVKKINRTLPRIAWAFDGVEQSFLGWLYLNALRQRIG